MKPIYFVVAALVAAPLFAVTVKECPEKLSVTLTKFEPISEEALAKSSDFWDDEEVAAAEKARQRLGEKYARYSGDMSLISAKKAICRYVDYDTDMKAKFFTRAGRDLLRVAVPYGGTHLGFYLDIPEYSTEGLKSKDSAGVVFEISGGNGEFSHVVNIGKVKSIELE